MLYTKAVYPNTLQLLKELQSLQSLEKYSLARGTALVLYFGHRISVDLDFFINKPFNTDKIIQEINLLYKKTNITILSLSENSISLIIKDVKVDILAHQYPLINEINEVDGLFLYSKEDIIAMKLNALANRGSKKDFFDIYEVLQIYSLQDVLAFFVEKYKNNDPLYIVRSLAYFDDAEKDLEPIMIKKYDWEKVKSFLNKTITNFLN